MTCTETTRMKQRTCLLCIVWVLLELVACVRSQRITGFTLMDTTTNSEIASLVNGDVIDLAEVGKSLTVRADVDDPDKTRNVILDIDNGFVERTDAFPPYALGGDTTVPVSLLTVFGVHSITATATSNVDGATDSQTVTFQIINGDESMAPSATPVLNSDTPKLLASLEGTVSGELKKWHKITIGFLGPLTGETADARDLFRNPFTDYRLDVTFSHVSTTAKNYTVPGYFAADGNAANTGSRSGTTWLVHFCPDEIGTWEYVVSFTEGRHVAQNGGGVAGLYFDGAAGSFDVAPTDKTGRDLRGKGRLQYVGEHYLRFAETGEWFLKAGSDSPENLLAYQDFDNTPNKTGYLKSWSPHVIDYRDGDPTWNNNKGQGLIGAINYLSNKGMNAISFLTFSMGGDDESVFMYISDQKADRVRMGTYHLLPDLLLMLL